MAKRQASLLSFLEGGSSKKQKESEEKGSDIELDVSATHTEGESEQACQDPQSSSTLEKDSNVSSRCVAQ